MKYIQIKFILCTMFVLSPFIVNAQTVSENETDSLSSEKKTLVQVAFRKMAQSDLLGGVSVINMEELTKKNYNTYSLDNMQGYIGGWNGNSLWGMDSDNAGYLVLVDGIPRDANNVQPTEIEQITFLKGAQAVVLYGSRAAKGAIYITTKRGKTEGLSLSVWGNTGFYVSKSYPEYLGSAEYMTLYNEARANDGLSSLYSETDIYNYASGENPFRYPNMSFYSSEYLKKAYNRSDVTAEISGGGKRAHFYSNIGYYHQDDLFKFGEAKNNSISRLNVRGNVDVMISNSINAYINANATFYDSKSAKGDYWEAASTFRPNRVAALIPLSYIDPNALSAWDLVNSTSNIIDGKYFLGGKQTDQTNIFADYYAAGSSKWTSRQFQFDTGIDIDLNRMLDGLSFHTKFAVDYATAYTTSFDNTYSAYMPTWSNYNGKDVIVNMTKYNNDEKPGIQNVSESTDKQTIAFSGQFDYKKTFDTDHNVSAMLIASGYQQTLSAEYHRICNANLALQLGYNFQNKYYADFGASEIYSAKLAEGHRNAFSPSLTLGWRLGKESFLSGSNAVDDLMLSFSGSILHQDIDIADYYMYKSIWSQDYGWSWYDGSLERYTKSFRGENEDLTFIKRKEFSINLRTSLWQKLLTADASFFINSTEGRVITPNALFPNYFATGYPEASFVPYMNSNNDKRVGFDFNINLNKHIGDVDFTLGVAGTYYDTKATKRSEIKEFAYEKTQGQAVDGIWGLKSDGLFQSQEEIDNSPEQTFGGTIRPGDIKYIDQNNDGIIDNHDQVFLGKGGWYGSPFTLGINLTAKWKDFTFFALATGNFGAYGVKNSSYYWVYGDSKYSAIVRNRWTEDTKNTATYPRLTTQSGSNNFQTSDFWMYKTDRFDLAKLQITYDLPKYILRNTFIHGLSAYVSGANLLTISKERKHMEMSVGSAPQTRYYNIGVKAEF
ncbi:SusC/RagA family TonB-linked outer membrane protein [Dysgonomonas sp. Marseille-P4677]|uniref:SusC/RagA family TonB-linked outer membrane protein n=1 Tax=Dysgonomonas sp. Marseille-P4677 TaxID=2364790 RepID=UPI0019124561|nr:SusC/RagA family TonB-linked outer membrane protein [Dysgonomonas sp. Marseille-P4677]MBK5721685.1 SusC/RagA family TonB-linked outer membrane protein [Dysgonomonas sp. Marseille-P4677]